MWMAAFEAVCGLKDARVELLVHVDGSFRSCLWLKGCSCGAPSAWLIRCGVSYKFVCVLVYTMTINCTDQTGNQTQRFQTQTE